MSDTQKRYTDAELIVLLQILVTDYNRKPTQREILDDPRLPTHHTYNKRFKSVSIALELAGMADVKESTMHLFAKKAFKHFGVNIVEEYAKKGKLVVDFVIKDKTGVEHDIDLIDINVDPVLLKEISLIRETLSVVNDSFYHQATNIGEVIKLALLYGENLPTYINSENLLIIEEDINNDISGRTDRLN